MTLHAAGENQVVLEFSSDEETPETGSSLYGGCPCRRQNWSGPDGENH